MKKMIFRLRELASRVLPLLIFSLGLGALPADAAETLSQYVNACKAQLNIQNVSIPDMDCYDGDLFAPTQTPDNPETGDPTNDYIGFKKLTDQAELVFACRWVNYTKQNRQKATSVELLIHDRQSGNTCFFSAIRDTTIPHSVPSNIVSPTSTLADTYWAQPLTVNATVACVGCHVSGPYIATPRIAPYLSKYGLMNNGHDTGSNITSADLNQGFNKAHVKYHAVVTTGVPGVTSAFSQWDSLKQSYMSPSDSGCSIGCHVVGSLSPQPDVVFTLHGPEIILASVATQLYMIDKANAMPPTYDDSSAYRWINLDTPADGVETENFADAKNATTTLVPGLLDECVAPGVLEAHTVGVPNEFAFDTVEMSRLPDRLRVFNLKEGLVCLNSDQEPGQSCHDYSIRYLCSLNNQDGTPTWSGWYRMDTPTGDGDHEERSKDQNICGGIAPIAIQTEVLTSSGLVDVMGPNDRLARFSRYGLTCNNVDQVDGKCSNYVVRYSNCGTTPPIFLGALTNANVPASGAKQLTAAANSLVKAQGHNNTWDTQTWTIAPVANTEFVRLKNTSNNVTVYLTVQSDGSTAGTAAFNSTATAEMWTIETISGSNSVRLKNVWTGKYLTMGDPGSYPNSPDYLPIFSQGLNTSWNTQRWIIQ